MNPLLIINAPTCWHVGRLFFGVGLLFIVCRQVFYLVDDVLELALGLEVKAETADGADDATYASSPEYSVGKGTAMKLIDFVQEPA